MSIKDEPTVITPIESDYKSATDFWERCLISDLKYLSSAYTTRFLQQKFTTNRFFAVDILYRSRSSIIIVLLPMEVNKLQDYEIKDLIRDLSKLSHHFYKSEILLNFTEISFIKCRVSLRIDILGLIEH